MKGRDFTASHLSKTSKFHPLRNRTVFCLLQSPFVMPTFPRFWAWYERNYRWNVIFAAALFTLQLVHLYWLTTDVVLLRLLGESFFSPTELWKYIIIAVDFAEIPAIITTSTLYIYDLRKGWNARSVLYLLFLNSQWLHIFWITDEFVIGTLQEGLGTIMPAWLAWIAIFIDYLELPVIIDTLRKAIFSLKEQRLTFWQKLRHAVRTFLWRQ